MSTLPQIRILVVANMRPDALNLSRGIFVRSQIEALRRTGLVAVDVEAFAARGRPWRYLLEAVRLRRRPPDADLVHAHYGLSGVPALGAASRDRPLVLTVHGRDCHHRLVRPITAAIARRCAAVIAVSDELASMCPFPVGDVIPIGVDLHRFRPMSRAEARRSLGLPASERLLLFPAHPDRPEKRVDRARRLTDSLPGVTLYTYHNTPSEQVPRWIAAADAVLVTSEREGYGLACMEALACNVPVLSTPVGVAREVLGRVPGALCAPYDLARWREHLQGLLADDDPHVDGRSVAAEQSTDVMAERTLAVYRRVLGRAQTGL